MEIKIQGPVVDTVGTVGDAAARVFGTDPQWPAIRDALMSSMTPEDWQAIAQAEASGESLHWPLSEVAKYGNQDHEV